MASHPKDRSKISLADTYDATISASTALTLNAATKTIDVAAIDKAIFLKWGGTASSTDFDAVIPANTVRSFTVPVGTTTANFIEQAATAILAVCEYS